MRSRHERRDPRARAARDEVASLLNLEPSQVAALTVEQAEAMAEQLQRQATRSRPRRSLILQPDHASELPF